MTLKWLKTILNGLKLSKTTQHNQSKNFHRLIKGIRLRFSNAGRDSVQDKSKTKKQKNKQKINSKKLDL